jgi:hypothetical protein
MIDSGSPAPWSLNAYAGSAPVTRTSDMKHHVARRTVKRS